MKKLFIVLLMLFTAIGMANAIVTYAISDVSYRNVYSIYNASNIYAGHFYYLNGTELLPGSGGSGADDGNNYTSSLGSSNNSTHVTISMVRVDGTNLTTTFPGTVGPQGETGATGPQGPAGTNGTNGADGAPGINGTNGIDGINGTNGIDGINGTNGIDGVNGTWNGLADNCTTGEVSKYNGTQFVCVTDSVGTEFSYSTYFDQGLNTTNSVRFSSINSPNDDTLITISDGYMDFYSYNSSTHNTGFAGLYVQSDDSYSGFFAQAGHSGGSPDTYSSIEIDGTSFMVVSKTFTHNGSNVCTDANGLCPDTDTYNTSAEMLSVCSVYNDTQRTVFGPSAGLNNSGSNLNAIGTNAGKNNAGAEVAALGYGAAVDNSGSSIACLGRAACDTNSGNYVTAIGRTAANENTKDFGTYIGYRAGLQNTGLYDFGFGAYSSEINKGDYVIGVGHQTNYHNIGNYTVAIGHQAGYSNTGNNNIFIGYQAGYANTESNKLIIIQNETNTVPLIKGDFATGEVLINNSMTCTVGNGLCPDTDTYNTTEQMRQALYINLTAQDACSEISGCVVGAITDGNTNWDNTYSFITLAEASTGLGNWSLDKPNYATTALVVASNSSMDSRMDAVEASNSSMDLRMDAMEASNGTQASAITLLSENLGITNGTANLANTTANNALPKAGGTMTANITIGAIPIIVFNSTNYISFNGTCWIIRAESTYDYTCN